MAFLEIGDFLIFKNLIGIYEKELFKKIDSGENYFPDEVSFINKYYYIYFDKDFYKVFLHLKSLSNINLKNQITSRHNSEALFIFLCEKYGLEIR